MIVKQAFSSARSELPMLYVLLALATVELSIVHMLVSLWSTTASRLLSLLTLVAIAQVAGMIVRIRRQPVALTDDGVIIRSAKGFAVTLSWTGIADVQRLGFGPTPAGAAYLQTALIAHPNVMITARQAFTVTRLWRTVSAKSMTLRLDEPDAFVCAVRHHLAMGADTGAPYPAENARSAK